MNTPKWKVEASLIEEYLFLSQLKRVRHNIFSREGIPEDKYLECIPFTWTAWNNLGTFLRTEYLYEIVVEEKFRDRLEEVKCVINEIFENPVSTSLTDDTNKTDGNGRPNGIVIDI